VPTPLPRVAHGGAAWPQACTLDESIAGHIRVLRLCEGEAVTLFDGEGGEFAATITQIAKRQVMVSLLAFDAVERESPRAITLVQALATGDKMDWIIQKATELGVAAIQPISTERATAKLTAERVEKRHAHWRAAAIAACEQCGRNRVPVIHPIQTLDAWLNACLKLPGADLRLMLHPFATASLLTHAETKPVAILIGPEGGFSDDELARAERAGVTAVRFGPRTLRTETAGLAAIAALQTVAGDLG
jgi:16S rRNA (uracil1498-N3)-methyltransferase